MNNGSFGSAIGGMSPELQAAMSRRAGGNPGGPMSQVSNSAPTADPTTQVPANPQLSPAPVSPASVGVPTSAIAPNMPASVPESQVIIKALDNRLKSISKINEMNGSI